MGFWNRLLGRKAEQSSSLRSRKAPAKPRRAARKPLKRPAVQDRLSELQQEMKAIEPQSPILREIVSLLQRGYTIQDVKEILNVPRLADLRGDTKQILSRLEELAAQVSHVPDETVEKLTKEEIIRKMVALARQESAAGPQAAPIVPKMLSELGEQAQREYAAQKVLEALADGMACTVSELGQRTGFTRQWVYKLLYKGWRADFKHSLEDPDPESLLGRRKVEVAGKGLPLTFRVGGRGVAAGGEKEPDRRRYNTVISVS